MFLIRTRSHRRDLIQVWNVHARIGLAPTVLYPNPTPMSVCTDWLINWYSLTNG